LTLLRAAQGSVTKNALDQAWPDAMSRDRALASLLMDGLVVAIADDTFSLPS
jgi:A/G-specific adenine glycosylase